MEHIRPEKIHAYMEGQLKGDESMATEGHLAVCEDCFKVFSGLREIGSAVKFCFKRGHAFKDCPEDWVVAALIRGELAATDAAGEHIKTCDSCLDRAAAYYKAGKAGDPVLKAPEAWVNKAVHVMQGDAGKETHVKETRFLAGVFDSIRRFSESLPPLPGYALAAASIFLLIWTVLPEKARVLNINSSQKITVRDAEPFSSLAFMGGDRVDSFEGMEVKKDRNKLVFSWRPISGVKQAEFTLKKKGFDRDTLVATMPMDGVAVTLPIEKIQYNERYEWTIKGMKGDGQRFEAMAEFVVTE